MYKRVLVYRRILVPLDGSEQSQKILDHAVAIAEKFNAEIVLLTVVPRAMFPFSGDEVSAQAPLITAEDMAQYQERMWSLYRKVLTEAEYNVRSEHPELKMTKILREGRPSSIIVDVARSDGVDLIVMGSRGIGGTAWGILGSTSRSVVESCNKPILIVN